MEKKKEIKDLVFVLDASGSMYNMVDDTIGGYNGYLDKMKDFDVRVTTVLFNTFTKVVNDMRPINKVKKLNRRTYMPGGCTALYDAIGKTIKLLDKKKSKKVLFIITTDGAENSSINYDKETICKMIKNHPNFEFVFLGADIDSYSEASKIGIDARKSINVGKSNEGAKYMYDYMAKVSSNFINDEEDILYVKD